MPVCVCLVLPLAATGGRCRIPPLGPPGPAVCAYSYTNDSSTKKYMPNCVMLLMVVLGEDAASPSATPSLTPTAMRRWAACRVDAPPLPPSPPPVRAETSQSTSGGFSYNSRDTTKNVTLSKQVYKFKYNDKPLNMLSSHNTRQHTALHSASVRLGCGGSGSPRHFPSSIKSGLSERPASSSETYRQNPRNAGAHTTLYFHNLRRC